MGYATHLSGYRPTMTVRATNEIRLFDQRLQLLEDKALYLPEHAALLVSDIHLGKAETFQSFGIPIPNQLNQENLDRLKTLVAQHQPQQIFILGDLFHSSKALVPEVLIAWDQFVQASGANVTLIVGNHDRRLVNSLPPMAMTCEIDAVSIGGFLLSHEPEHHPQSGLNICGHIHPVVKLRSHSDSLRLPCFYFEQAQNRLTLPSFGEFTGGYEIDLRTQGNCAYVVCEGDVIPFEA